MQKNFHNKISDIQKNDNAFMPARLVYINNLQPGNTPERNSESPENSDSNKTRGLEVPSLITKHASEKINRQIEKVTILAELSGKEGLIDPENADEKAIIERIKNLKTSSEKARSVTIEADRKLRIFLQSLLSLKDQDNLNLFNQEDILSFAGAININPLLSEIEKIQNNNNNSSLEALSEQDIDFLKRAKHNTINTIVNRLKSENKLTENQASSLLSKGPKSPEEIKRIKENFLIKLNQYDRTNQSTYYQKLSKIFTSLKNGEMAFEKSINELSEISRTLTEYMRKAENEAIHKAKKAKHLEELSKSTGLQIEEGTELESEVWLIDPLNPDHSGQKVTLTIESVSFNPVKWIEQDEIFDIAEPSQPTIEYSYIPVGQTQKVTELKTAADFKRMISVNNVSEKIDSLGSLESKLNISGKIREGSKFEFFNKQNNQSEIIEIKPLSSNTIQLSRPVIIEEANPQKGVESATIKEKLTYGEFSKWYKKMLVFPLIENLQELNSKLEEHTDSMNKKFQRTEHYPPININSPKPIYLMYDDQKENIYVVTDANDQEITFDNGEKKSPTDFLRWVKENGVELADPETRAEREAQRMASSETSDSDLEKKIKEYQNKYEQELEDRNKSIQEGKKESAKTADKPGILKSVYNFFAKDTVYMDAMQVYEMFKQIKEFFEKKREKTTNRKVGEVGEKFYKGMPFVSSLSDKNRELKAGEDADEVKAIKERMEKTMTPSERLEEVFKAKTKNKLKAALESACELGLVRWEDDEKLHEHLNKVLPPATYGEKYPDHQNDLVVIGDKKEGVVKRDQLELRIDEYYGEGTFSSMYSSNMSKYNEKKQYANNNFHNTEFLHGGVLETLQEMLYNHINNRGTVDAATFDGLLEYGMANEFKMEDSLMLLFTALGVKNKNGETLIANSRFYPYIASMKENPAFIFFAVGHEQVDENGNPTGEKGKLSFNNFQKLYREVVVPDVQANMAKGEKGSKAFKAGKNMVDWIQREVLTHKRVKTRISDKSSANVDPMLFYHVGPILSETTDIEHLLRQGYGGRQNLTLLKNMYAGYNNQMKIKADLAQSGEALRVEEFASMISAFIFYDSVLRNQVESKSTRFLSFNEPTWNSKPEVDKETTVREFSDNSRQFVKEFLLGVAKNTNDSQLEEIINTLLIQNKRISDSDINEVFNLVQKKIITFARDNKSEFSKLTKLRSGIKGISGMSMTKEEAEQAEAKEAEEQAKAA
ncbi:hypothetical protein GF376_04325 [Candidatus Peregrinibacteria bacterium]|nr:hypothetical protein [Candidatus Peregrinibacteria bacterium]